MCPSRVYISWLQAFLSVPLRGKHLQPSSAEVLVLSGCQCSLPHSSAFSFPSTPTCPGTQAILVLLTSKFSLCRHSHRGPDDSRTLCQDDYSPIQLNGNALSKLSSVQITFKLGNLLIASGYLFLGPKYTSFVPLLGLGSIHVPLNFLFVLGNVFASQDVM